MDKINFDLNFLDNNENENKTKKEKRTKISSFWIYIGLILICFILNVGLQIKDEQEEAKQRKISELTIQANEYRKVGNPVYQDVIDQLSQLAGKRQETIRQDIEYTFQKEKAQKVSQLVKAKLQNNIVDETLKSECLKTYFNNDVVSLEDAIKNEFLYQKTILLQKLIQDWKNNADVFERNKQKYAQSLFDGNMEQLNIALDQMLGYKNFTLQEQKLPKTGIMKIYTNKKAIAPFKITTQKNNETDSDHSDHYFVKLVDRFTGQTVVTIFIRSGSNVEVTVPSGSYKLRYAVGNKWYGEKDLFGPLASYNKSEEILNFSENAYTVSGHSLFLYKVMNGNFSTQTINQNEF